MPLRDLTINSRYYKGLDIVDSFFIPCLKNSRHYNRVAGYFSSAVFDIGAEGFLEFFNNGGSYQLVCSPYLKSEDSSALLSASLNSESASDAELIKGLLSIESFAEPAKILCYLIKSGKVTVKLAIAESLMHEKIGIFSDGSDRISFSGSINESKQGWSEDGNLEYFDAFVSWAARDQDRLFDHEARFNDFWLDSIDGVSVRSPDSSFMEIVDSHAAEGEKFFTLKLKELAEKEFPYEPLDYQKAVIANWKANERRGIVKFCTGAGKTVVGMLTLDWAFKQNIPALVLVPSKTLLRQWTDEIKGVFPTARVLKVGDGNNQWKSPHVLEAYLEPSDGRPSVVCAISVSASANAFVSRVRKYRNTLVVADEVHNFGAQKTSEILKAEFNFRMGLSATPERFGDPEGTDKILQYFGEILQPVIDIPTAIKKKRLVPYSYDFEVAPLSDSEQENWDRLTKRISRLVAQGYGKPGQDEEQSGPSQLQQLILSRSRIAKKAEAKLEIGLGVIKDTYKPGQKWLVFLEDKSELRKFGLLLKREGMDFMTYDGELSSEARILVEEHLTHRGGIVLSMRCLDEGVDIPSVTYALIMASSQNPRQFVQRRGRVLRFAGKNKRRAYIWDIIAMPQIGFEDSTRALITAEIARAVEFASYAENASGVTARLGAFLARHGLSVADCLKTEIEEDLEHSEAP